MAVKLLTSGGGGVNLVPSSSIASDVTVTVPSKSGTTVLTDVADNIGIAATGANYITMSTNGSERMRLDSSGNLLVGATSETFNSVAGGGTYALGVRNLQKNNSVLLLGGTSDSTAQYKIVFANGGTAVGTVYTNGTTTSYNTSSDYRLKEDYQPVADAIVRLNKLKPVNFAWKVDGSRCDGFLAHELQEVIPEAATGHKDEVDSDGNPMYQGIDQSKIVPLLTAALQELSAQNKELTQRIEALEYTKQGE